MPNPTTNKPKAKTPVVIAPSAFATTELYRPVVEYLREADYTVYFVRYRGHFGDTEEDEVEQHSLDTYYEDLCGMVERAEREYFMELGTSAVAGHKYMHIIGFSMGAMLAARFAKADRKGRLMGVTLYGSPGMGGAPVWQTFWSILTTWAYAWPIFFKSWFSKGSIRLTKEDAQKWLFNGDLHPLIDRVSQVEEGGRVCRELLLSRIQPKTVPVPFTVFAVTKEHFHRNDAKEQWVQKCEKPAQYQLIEGSHFGMLVLPRFHKQLIEALQWQTSTTNAVSRQNSMSKTSHYGAVEGDEPYDPTVVASKAFDRIQISDPDGMGLGGHRRRFQT